MGEVKLSNIRKTYKGGEEVVKGVSFAVKDKEFLVFVVFNEIRGFGREAERQ